jgi:hypothetical protein
METPISHRQTAGPVVVEPERSTHARARTSEEPRGASGTLRAALATVVAASAVPYGYTLTIWTSGAVTTHARGIPTTGDALLLLTGAVLGFAITAALAYGHPSELLAAREHGSVRLWGGFHLVSVGLAIGAAALATEVVKDPVVWMIVGLAATVVYLVVIALQFTLADAHGAKPEKSGRVEWLLWTRSSSPALHGKRRFESALLLLAQSSNLLSSHGPGASRLRGSGR